MTWGIFPFEGSPQAKPLDDLIRHCCVGGSPGIGEGGGLKRDRRSRPLVRAPSAFTGFRFLT